MTDTPDTLDGLGGDDLIAAEFALGLLTGTEQTQAAQRWRIDPTFAALVEDWDIWLSELTIGIAPVAPPKNLLRKITNEAYPDSPKGIWRQLGVIPAFITAGVAALVVLVAVQFGDLLEPNAPLPTFSAELAAEDNSLVLEAAYLDDGRLFVERQTGQSAPDRSFEVWLIAGDDAPVSLGLLASNEAISELVVPENLRSRLGGAILAISDEPLGGSATGGPTGAVLAAGPVVAL